MSDLDARCQLSDVRCQKSNDRCQISDVRLDDRKESTGKYQEMNTEKFTGNYRKRNKKVLGM